jgi:hypothetical protein
MARKVVLIVSAMALFSVVSVAAVSGVAGAASYHPVLPGNVTCNPSGGVWSGRVTFTPPLMNGGIANKEKIVVKATLGNTTSPCVTNAGFVAIGAIAGKIKVKDPGTANNCATIFGGSALPPAVLASAFKLVWTSPPGAPTNWTQPSFFSVVGSVTGSNIAISAGSIAGSFTPGTPSATLSDANWPGATGAVATGCASSTGLSALTLSTSSGAW